MTDAIVELAAQSRPHHELDRFVQFHTPHPEVLDFLVLEVRLRIAKGFGAFSFGSLWNYCRWKLELESGPLTTYTMNDHLTPFYARAITILHPDLNGRAEMRASLADKLFGTSHAAGGVRPGDYATRLQWADGIAIEDGWRPSTPHVPRSHGKRRPNIH